ncbi:MAG TPA: hypothetical protein VK200_01255 [Candidatus Limnocylindrales bacterium]|nr:hypothetical protein [Candidatus Limnocylindrales bacterium]
MKLLNSIPLIIILLLAGDSNQRAESPNPRPEWERTVEAAKKVFDPSPAIRLIKETLGELGK